MADTLGFGMRPKSHRVERFCPGCGQTDADPHAVHCLPDGTISDMHIDCCAAAGCPDGTCGPTMDSNGGKNKASLLKHLEAGGADHLATGSKGK